MAGDRTIQWLNTTVLIVHTRHFSRAICLSFKTHSQRKVFTTSCKLIGSISCYWRNKTRKLRNIKTACQFYLSVWWTYMCFLRASGILKVIPHSAHTHDFSVSGNKTNIMRLDSAKLFNISFSYINEMFNCDILKPLPLIRHHIWLHLRCSTITSNRRSKNCKQAPSVLLLKIFFYMATSSHGEDILVHGSNLKGWKNLLLFAPPPDWLLPLGRFPGWPEG